MRAVGIILDGCCDASWRSGRSGSASVLDMARRSVIALERRFENGMVIDGRFL